jgi:hypothetical protein
MKFKPLDLKVKYDRLVGYNDTKVRTIKLEAHTKLFGIYKVWQALSGRCFVEVPYQTTVKDTGTIIMSTRRKEVKSVEEGKLFCMEHYKNLAREAFEI